MGYWASSGMGGEMTALGYFRQTSSTVKVSDIGVTCEYFVFFVSQSLPVVVEGTVGPLISVTT